MCREVIAGQESALGAARTETLTTKGSLAVLLKKQGKGVKDSFLVDGFGLNCVRACEAMPKSIKGAKIALLDYNLNKYRTPMGVEVVIKDPAELEAVRPSNPNQPSRGPIPWRRSEPPAVYLPAR